MTLQISGDIYTIQLGFLLFVDYSSENFFMILQNAKFMGKKLVSFCKAKAIADDKKPQTIILGLLQYLLVESVLCQMNKNDQ